MDSIDNAVDCQKWNADQSGRANPPSFKGYDLELLSSAVESHLCVCETELDSQNPEIDMLDQMGVE